MTFYTDVKQGTLSATMVLAVPRSASSMLGRALSTSSDVSAYLYQPFYATDDKQSLDRQLAAALGKMSPASTQKPHHIVTKIMAESVSGQHFRPLKDHCTNVVALLRDPQAQALSVYRAVWQKPSGKAMSTDELAGLKIMRLVSHKDRELLDPYLTTPWQHMERNVQQLVTSGNGPQATGTWCVMDGDIIRAAPETSMRRLCDLFGLSYSAKMIHNWEASDEKVTVGRSDNKYGASWVARANRSSSVKAPTRMTPRLEDFSPSVRSQVEKNLVTYVTLMATNTAALPTQAHMAKMLRSGFAEISPLAAYTLVSLWEESDTRESRLAYLRDHLPEYNSSYNIIDTTIDRLQDHGKIDAIPLGKPVLHRINVSQGRNQRTAAV